MARRRKKGRSPPKPPAWWSDRLRETYRKDKGTCHLCHLPVPMDADPHADQAATVDHVVPVTYGGSDDLMNLRLAHRLCNDRRQSVPMWAIPPGMFDNIWR